MSSSGGNNDSSSSSNSSSSSGNIASRHDALPGLRHIRSKGSLPAGAAYLLTGPTGSGKTPYCAQFLREGMAGSSGGGSCRRGMFVSLDPSHGRERLGGQQQLLGGNDGSTMTAELVVLKDPSPAGAGELFERIRAASPGTRIAVDSLTYLLPRMGQHETLKFAAGLYDALRSVPGATSITTIVPAGEFSDAVASIFDGVIQLKFEDQGNELVRSIRLLSLKGAYHSPVWAQFRILEDGRLAFGFDPPEAEVKKCKLCDKPIAAGKAAYDSDSSAFHPHCLETYRKLSDIYGASVIYAVVPAGVINANFFFIDIVGLSDPAMSVEKQIKKIEVLNSLIMATEAMAGTPRDKRIVLPTGDGMAIGFLLNPELPLQLSIQLHRKLAAFNRNAGSRDEAIGVRIGLSSGPVFVVSDVNNNQNVWGPGIILARRVMDIGDDRHILIAGGLAEALINLKDEYRAAIKLVSADFRIKHGQSIKVYSAFASDYGNPATPSRLAAVEQQR